MPPPFCFFPVAYVGGLAYLLSFCVKSVINRGAKMCVSSRWGDKDYLDTCLLGASFL